MASADGLRRSVKGLSEAEFRERFGTEETCRRALFEMRWPEGLTYPACGGRSFCELKGRRLFQCGRCKRQVRLTAGTVFQDTKPPLTTWFSAIYHLTQGEGDVSSIEPGRRLGVKQQTAWLMKHKLMRAMGAREAAKAQALGPGRVEIDDAYLGGERPGGRQDRVELGGDVRFAVTAQYVHLVVDELDGPVRLAIETEPCLPVGTGPSQLGHGSVELGPTLLVLVAGHRPVRTVPSAEGGRGGPVRTSDPAFGSRLPSRARGRSYAGRHSGTTVPQVRGSAAARCRSASRCRRAHSGRSPQRS
jgi:hypothetical protein